MVEMKINRKWFFVLVDGPVVLDWGQGLAQEVVSGSFRRYRPKDYQNQVTDNDLDALKNNGRIRSYDENNVILYSWD